MIVHTIVCLQPNRYTRRTVWGIPLCDYCIQHLSRYTVVNDFAQAQLPATGYVAMVYDDMPLVNDDVLHRLAVEMERRGIVSMKLGNGRMFKAGKQNVPAKQSCHAAELTSVVDETTYAAACEGLRMRIIAKHLARGVVIPAPGLVCIDWQAHLAEGVRVSPFVCVEGRCEIGAQSVLLPHTYLASCRIGARAVVGGWHQNAEIGDDAQVGVYTYSAHTGLGNGAQLAAMSWAQRSLVGDDAVVQPHTALVGSTILNNVVVPMGTIGQNEEISI